MYMDFKSTKLKSRYKISGTSEVPYIRKRTIPVPKVTRRYVRYHHRYGNI